MINPNLFHFSSQNKPIKLSFLFNLRPSFSQTTPFLIPKTMSKHPLRNILIAVSMGILSIGQSSGDTLANGSTTLKVTPQAPPQAEAFPLGDVRLGEGIFKVAQDRAVDYLLSLEPDRFLANFRKEAGLPPKAEQYGGWEQMGVSGHSGGHYLSACAIAWATTGNPLFLERVRYFVDELARCQQEIGTGYVAAIPDGKRVFAEVASGDIRSAGFDLNGSWVPFYTLHKLMAGLRDAHRLAGYSKALEVNVRFAEWVEKTLSGLNEAQMQQILACEHGGMNETLADLYADTGDPRFLALSRRFHHRAILDPLAEGRDILPGKHANTQIPKIVGVATRYELTGDSTDRAISEFFWNRVVHHHSYVTGGHCNYEHFGPPDQLNDRLSPATTETCNVNNMLKLTTHIFGWTASPDAADFYERALLNHIRSTQHPDGRIIYNLSLEPGHYKEYQTLFDSFTCCNGTGMENHVKYPEAIYFHDDNGIWINLYISSQLNWKEKGFGLKQETGFPYSETARFTVTTEKPQELSLRFRHPFWAAPEIELLVNGKPQAVTSRPSSYAEISRVWSSGDTVEIRLPMSLRLESMPDNEDRIAVFYGPVLLAADLGPVQNPAADQPDFVPVLVTDAAPVENWVFPENPGSLTFRTEAVGKPADVPLVPFFSLHDRRYTVYLDLFTQDEWSRKEKELKAQRAREEELARRTTDILRIGEMQPERDHQLAGENTSAGEAMGRKWRHATNGGWFAFRMKVDPSKKHQLLCTYWGDDANNRTFDILVDGNRIATQTLDHNEPGRFFDVAYDIPAEYTNDKNDVVIRFQAHPNHWAGGLFGCRMMLSD
jgi:DUF1680 family protein